MADPRSSSAPPQPGGLTYGLLAYGFWGFAPLFWRLLSQVPAIELLAHRMVWACLWFCAWLAVQRRLPELAAIFKNGRTVLRLSLSAALLAVNWFVFVYGVLVSRVLEVSLGYFINPMVSVALGRIVLGERLRPLQAVAVAVALTGIAVAATLAGGVPWISLVLAGSFGTYGLLRKTLDVPPLTGSTTETIVMLPLGLLALAMWGAQGQGHFLAQSLTMDALLVLTGLVTALPLLWFVNAARRIPLTTLGFLQFLAPSVQFVLAKVVFDEPLHPTRLISFVIVWTAVAIFIVDMHRAQKDRHQRNESPPQ